MADQKKLRLAEQMDRDGKSVDEIWKQTGWKKGDEGKWRFDIGSDIKLKHSPEETLERLMGEEVELDNEEYEQILTDSRIPAMPGARLSDLIDGEIFKAYPDFKDIPVYVKLEHDGRIPESSTLQPEIDIWGNNISILQQHGPHKFVVLRFRTNLRQIDKHVDLDHYIRNAITNPKARFTAPGTDSARGTGIELGVRSAKDERRATMVGNRGRVRRKETHQDAERNERDDGLSLSLVHVLSHELQHSIQGIEGFEQGAQAGSPLYDHVSGELETRDVQDRIGKSAEWRKNNPPNYQGTDKKDRIVRRRPVDTKASRRVSQAGKWGLKTEPDFNVTEEALIRLAMETDGYRSGNAVQAAGEVYAKIFPSLTVRGRDIMRQTLAQVASHISKPVSGDPRAQRMADKLMTNLLDSLVDGKGLGTGIVAPEPSFEALPGDRTLNNVSARIADALGEDVPDLPKVLNRAAMVSHEPEGKARTKKNRMFNAYLRSDKARRDEAKRLAKRADKWRAIAAVQTVQIEQERDLQIFGLSPRTVTRSTFKPKLTLIFGLNLYCYAIVVSYYCYSHC